MKEYAKKLFELIKYLARIESTSTAGRINMLGMLLSVILAGSLSLGSLCETLVRLIHPNVTIGAPLVQIFVIFCIFTLICTGMLAYLEGPRRDRQDSQDGQDRLDSQDRADTQAPEPDVSSRAGLP